MSRMLLQSGILAGLLVCSAAALALDFRSVADPAAILYDAPSTKAQKLFLLSRDYPVEVVVKVEGWTKVRDDTGDFGWIENRQLSERRTVMVKSSGAEARQSASDAAALEGRNALGFAQETVAVVGIVAQAGAQALEGNGAFEGGILGAVDLTHASSADRRDDFVGTEKCSVGQRHGRRSLSERMGA